MTYIVETKSYDYFVGTKVSTKEFNTLLEAWGFYKKASNHDFYYENHFEATYPPKTIWSPKKETQPKHGLVLGYAPAKEDILLPTLEEGVFGVFTDVKDIIPSGVEEEYFFDKDDIEF